MGITADYNNKDYEGIIPSIPPVNSMLLVPKAQKALQECVGDNQIETIQINSKKGTPYSLPRGSILARKPLLTPILPEPALTNDKRWSNKKCKHQSN
jgi:hypothetical protein